MYSTKFLPWLIRHFKFSRLINCLPFEFDTQPGKITGITSKWRIRVCQIQSILGFAYWLILLHHFCFGQGTMLKKLQGFPFLICFTILIGCGFCVDQDVAPIQMINSILNFEKRLLKSPYFIEL